MTHLKDFLQKESVAGLILILAAAIAIVLDNSRFSDVYDGLLSTRAQITVGSAGITKPLLLWINDGLMAIFFLLVGLEIKREILDGELADRDKAALPILAAVGGMAFPALIFTAFNWQSPANMAGWAIPAATDIAFALGVLSLFGRRVPVALKVFLLTVAIIDDLGAIIIIAIFYTSELSTIALGLAALGAVGLLLVNRAGVVRLGPYILLGIFIWVSVLKSGVHATLAGVILAMAIPLRRGDAEASPLHALEHDLHPWIAFGVMPLFAFANAGVHLGGLQLDQLFDPLPVGIALGLLIGKPLGVVLFSLAGIRLGLCRLPEDMSLRHLFAAGCMAGIGFTMSLFIGTLAFDDPAHATLVRLGVLFGSLTSAVVGGVILMAGARGRAETVAQD